MKSKIENFASVAISTLVSALILAGFTFTLIGWVLWAAKWVLSMIGVM